MKTALLDDELMGPGASALMDFDGLVSVIARGGWGW